MRGIEHRRYIYPVGQGGFAVENILGYTVAYDCGSITNQGMLESCIDYAAGTFKTIDVLFLSHFDKDHVNGLTYLLSKAKVLKAYTPKIDDEFKTIYDVSTNSAYTETLRVLRDTDVTCGSGRRRDADNQTK